MSSNQFFQNHMTHLPQFHLPYLYGVSLINLYVRNISGVHRQMGVHITKVKSVNLDKWPAGKIELFQNVSNDLVNSYWEKNMPKGFRKPDANASNKEVTNFLEDKYVRKKWANTDEWANDPAWLYENKPKKF